MIRTTEPTESDEPDHYVRTMCAVNRIVRPVSGILLRRLALASMVANVGIVVTGGAVRLTGSGPRLPHLAPVHRRLVRHHRRRWASTA